MLRGESWAVSRAGRGRAGQRTKSGTGMGNIQQHFYRQAEKIELDLPTKKVDTVAPE